MADDDGFLSRWARRKAVARSGAPAPEPPAVAEAPAPKPVAPPRAPAAVATPTVRPAGADTAAVRADPERSRPADVGADTDAPAAEAGDEAKAPPPPTLADVAELTSDSDFSRFVRADVDPGVRNAAMKKLFAAPQFNVMDGLDIYIDDYSLPSPMTASTLRKMAQTAFLGLVQAPPAGAAPASPATPDIAPVPASDPDTPSTPGDGDDAGPDRDEPAPTPAHEDTDLRLQPHDAPGPERAEPGAEPDAGGER